MRSVSVGLLHWVRQDRHRTAFTLYSHYQLYMMAFINDERSVHNYFATHKKSHVKPIIEVRNLSKLKFIVYIGKISS